MSHLKQEEYKNQQGATPTPNKLSYCIAKAVQNYYLTQNQQVNVGNRGQLELQKITFKTSINLDLPFKITSLKVDPGVKVTNNTGAYIMKAQPDTVLLNKGESFTNTTLESIIFERIYTENFTPKRPSNVAVNLHGTDVILIVDLPEYELSLNDSCVVIGAGTQFETDAQ